jgi:uncharacterized membrane protein
LSAPSATTYGGAVQAPSRTSLGRVLLGIAIAAFGVEDLVRGELLPELQPAPAGLPARAVLAYLTGAILLAAALGLIANRRVQAAARAITAVLALSLIAGYAPILIAAPRNGGAWTGAFEVVAIAAAAARLGFPARPALGRLGFAVALPVFGLLHFIYVDYVASVIPKWLPGHVFWAYATGVAHVAGGAALLTGIQARLAAILLAVMFGTWVVILHLPRALAAFDHRGEWTSLFVALAMCAGSVLLADDRPAT